MIVLYESTETKFETNGLGCLSDATSCVVLEERNGSFELEMMYPVTGRHFSELQMRRIIMAKPNPFANPQPFRIYALTKPINGIATVNAEHISYDMSGYPVSPFSANNVTTAFDVMKKACAVNCPFTFWTDKTTSATMKLTTPSSMRALLGGVEGSVLDVYGGEYEFDIFSVKLHNCRGNEKENGEKVTIRYGKNLTDLNQEENCSSVYTGVYPFWYSEQEDGGLVQLDEKIVNADGNYGFTRIVPLDLSQVWSEKPTQEEIRKEAKSYMKNNNIGVPKVSLTVSFVQLAQSEEYLNYVLLENVHLCDKVIVQFPELGVDAEAKCVSTTYNVLTNKYDKIELGEARSNLASTVSNQMREIEKTPNRTFMEQAIENATKLISGGLGGYVIMHSSTNGKHPDEILIMDTDDILTATKVWRWNKGGLGYSDKGYNGPYETAITQNGQIVADFVAAGTMSANRINGGTLVLGGKDNGNGTCLVKDNNGNILVTLDENGITLSDNMKISYGNVSDTPDITEITKNTVNTSYVNSLNITAKEVMCKNEKHQVNVQGGFSKYLYDGTGIGHIGTNNWVGSNKRGLIFDLDILGNYMGWGRLTDDTSLYMMCLWYSRDDDMLHVGSNLDMRGYTIKNASFENGLTCEIPFIQILEVNADGIVTRWGAGASLKFENGLLVDARYYT